MMCYVLTEDVIAVQEDGTILNIYFDSQTVEYKWPTLCTVSIEKMRGTDLGILEGAGLSPQPRTYEQALILTTAQLRRKDGTAFIYGDVDEAVLEPLDPMAQSHAAA